MSTSINLQCFYEPGHDQDQFIPMQFMSSSTFQIADLVTADGEEIKVNEKSHPDLFWAMKGYGANFGYEIISIFLRLFNYRSLNVQSMVLECLVFESVFVKRYCLSIS